MFKDTIKSALISLSPIWSNELIRLFALDNNYIMAITMILSETITFLSEYLTDTISITLVLLIGFFVLLNLCGINMINYSLFMKSPNSIVVIGTEKYSNNKISLICSKAFKSVNLMLINKYKIKKLRYLKDSNFDIIVDDMINYKLEPDLYVSVKRDQKDTQKIMITLSSYNLNIDTIISNAIATYD
jgi:hypothetical protein